MPSRNTGVTAETADVERVTRGEKISGTKRTLLKAGWAAPVVAAISLPASSYVANGSGFDPYKD
jgi:hypothetical protein